MTRSRCPEWENARIFAVNKEPGRCTAVPYADEQSALGGESSPYVSSLNGLWDFHWASKPADRPIGFYRQSYNLDRWSTLTVPSHWELHGYGAPIYAPYHMPKSLRKRSLPNIDPNNNPVGSYRRTFSLPESWAGREVFIHFGGVSSAFYLWINGQRVGYSQGSMLPAEFRITRYLKPGENSVAAEVYRWSDGSYLENQDMWFLSGIYRDVALIAMPEVHIRDVVVTSELDSDFGDAILRVRARVRNLSRQAGEPFEVEVRLCDDRGTVMATAARRVHPGPSGEEATQLELDIAAPAKWTAETPTLYSVLVSLRHGDGHAVDVRTIRHGFRQVEIRNRQLMLNGQPILLKGVNRHDWDPVTGRSMTYERLREDILIMKRHNINAVRTSHYPDDPRFYALCDELGLYVMDECNLETHGYRREMRGDLQWLPAMVDRLERMIARDRNHACILLWSLGNESCSDIRFRHLAQVARELDHTRPIHYEPDHRGKYIDVYSVMYPSPQQLEAMAQGRSYRALTGALRWDTLGGPGANDKPLMLCEYAHAMGNSLGNFGKFVEVFEKYPHCAGGFVWDFADQSILASTPDGRPFWAIGGDLGDEYDFRMFGCNGIVAADRSPHPALFEVKKGYQDIAVQPIDLAEGRIIIRNKHRFATLGAQLPVALRWRITVDGVDVQQGELAVPSTGPMGSTELTIPFETQELGPGAEAHLCIDFVLQEPTPWAEAGHILASEQFSLPLEAAPRTPPNTEVMPSLAMVETPTALRIVGSRFEAVIDKSNAELQSWRVDDHELIAEPLRPNLWRVPIDNEVAAQILVPLARRFDLTRRHWRGVAEARKLQSLQVRTMDDSLIEVAASWTVKYGLTPLDCVYRIYGTGDIAVQCRFAARRELPRLGVQMAVPGRYQRMTWLGRGPHETMWDRKVGAAVGIYSDTVENLIHDYVRPQENGNHTDVRWATLTDESGRGLLVSSEGCPFLNITARPYTQEDLAAASHIHELPRRDTVSLFIDFQQRGVGGDIPIASRPHDEFRLHRRTVYRFGFRLSPYRRGDALRRDVDWSDTPASWTWQPASRASRRRLGAGAAAGFALLAIAHAWLRRLSAQREQGPS